MNKILVASLAQRISLGMITMEQVPPIYREAVQAWIDSENQQAELEARQANIENEDLNHTVT